MNAFMQGKLNSQLLPKDFPREFDAHVYYSLSGRADALEFRSKAIEKFNSQEVFVGEMIDRQVGPHLQPMFEINFPEALFSEVVLWLLQEHKDLSILVHKLTGDDLADHTSWAMWIGQQLELNLSIFKKA